MKRAAGFSLLELLLVLAIFSLMAAAFSGSFSKGVSAAEMRNASRDIMAALRSTRSKAMVSHQEQVLMIDTEEKTYLIPGEKPAQLPEELEISLTTARRELVSEEKGGIRFFPDGASTGGKVILHANKRQYEITVAWLTGEARLVKKDD